MGIHSKILIHWTGKDIEESGRNKPGQYIERLKDDFQNGLYTKRTTEASTRKIKVERIVRICFTEIRLSQASTHAERYGKLGIGFAREFIMNRGGRPVIYVPYEPHDGLLENSIKTVHERSKDKPDLEDIHRSAKHILTHVKRMWDENNDEFFEEMEWRLVYDESPENKHFEAVGSGVFRFRFVPSDIKVVIFPDKDTKKAALEDDYVGKLLSEHMPIMATLDDCSNF